MLLVGHVAIRVFTIFRQERGICPFVSAISSQQRLLLELHEVATSPSPKTSLALQRKTRQTDDDVTNVSNVHPSLARK